MEHDPHEIWRTPAGHGARRTGRRPGSRPATSARSASPTSAKLPSSGDRKTGLPIHHGIVWQDRRAEPTCQQLREAGHSDTILQKTGLRIDAYFSGTKLQWLLDHVPGARDAAERGELAFGTVDSWLIWQLTGGQRHVTDVSNASRTMLFNVHTNQWDADLLALLHIPASLMPEVLPSGRPLWPHG